MSRTPFLPQYMKTALALFAFISHTFAIPYSEYILAPSSRTLYPASVYKVNGTVENAESLTNSAAGNATFTGTNSSVTFDYGKNIAGLVSVTVGTSSSPDAFIGLTYTESSEWISDLGSDATAFVGIDAILWLPVGQGAGTYSVSREHERGGFRYLSLITNTSATIEVTSVSTNFTAVPVNDPQAYTGYFHSNDELLNRIWYAGAYTNQLCTIDPAYGNSDFHLGIVTSNLTTEPPKTIEWYSNDTITNGSSAIVDGARRDRLVWPGDITVEMPTIFASTNDLASVRNGIESLLNIQNPSTGQLPYAGVPLAQELAAIPGGVFSFTYHLYSLISMAQYYLYSGDIAWVQANWNHFTAGLEYSLSTIDSTGLMNVTTSADWLRVGMGGHNIEANAILYYTINQGLLLADALNATSVISNWTDSAAGIKAAANTLLWNSTAGLYTDNETTTLMPQDGNAWAVRANLTLNDTQASSISSALASRWGELGAPAPEAGSTGGFAVISPFIGGIELEAHFMANAPELAFELLRREWGFMVTDPRMTNSTFIEGYSANGSLHYAPYTNDALVSHAHGWATAPTYLLSTYVAGLKLASASGTTWEISPQLGDLTFVEAGFQTALGSFSVAVQTSGPNGTVTSLNFSTPAGTRGTVRLPGCDGSLVGADGSTVALMGGLAEGVMGGNWSLAVNSSLNAAATGSASPPQDTGAASQLESRSLGACVAALSGMIFRI